jgi:hypothetical protein
MYFGTRHLFRHKKIYRSLDLPFGIARLWQNIEEVSFEYNEARDEVVVRPVRQASGTQAQAKATAKAQAGVEAKAEPADHSAAAQNHLPNQHFKMT